MTRWYGVPTGIVGLYQVVALTRGVDLAEAMWPIMRRSLQLTTGCLVVWLIVFFYREAFRSRSIGELVKNLRSEVVARPTIERVSTLPFLVFISTAMFYVFAHWKRTIAGYTWDVRLADLDRLLHFGVDPWRLSHAIFGWATPGIDWWYWWVWALVTPGLLLAILTWDRLDRRARYLTANLILWPVAGSLLAVVFASGGPVYYEAFTGDADRFAEIFRSGTPNFDRIRALLWDTFSDSSVDSINGGISAMPSLHIGAATLTVLWGFDVGRWPGILLAAYAMITFVGSVHLGWHYAVDGYVGALVAVGAWYVAGRITGSAGGFIAPTTGRSTPVRPATVDP